MAKIGRFRNEAARTRFVRAYEALEAQWPIASTLRDVETSFGSTHVRQSGSGTGTPLVLLHPVGGNSLYWRNVIEALARDRIVYALDTIGTAGRSVQTAPVRGEADLARWLDEVLAALGVERAHVLGYSHGAWHATLFALRTPGRLVSTTLIEPGGVFVKPSWSVLLKMLRAGLRPTDRNMRRMQDWLTPGVTMSETEWELAMAAFRGFRMGVGWSRLLKDAELQAITTPTLVIFGGASVSGDAEAAARQARRLPNSEVEIYPGIGHGILDQIPGTIVPRVLDFIEKYEEVPA
ncbi:alpha/beta fold hydrolase [Nocardia terpenica]|uniref:Alpha/beta hydrolase n=1 Tax=Nocardia terpenica TaxID=455432 RepID=A0A291RKS4_9NOCA|nr:alpha/beta fold hydrolase [Nocardia terpenica]ATL68186.1 alpha/beta hydrolase [Nocardia terpenica]